VSVAGYFSKRGPANTGKYYASRDDYDPVLRAHLNMKPPKPEATCPSTGNVRVNGEWMTKKEYRARYPNLDETE
jgi:hypothetical protein